MPCILKVKVASARDLPVMDKTSDLTDAYVQIKFADNDELRTQICKRTLSPVWNEDFRFEVTDDGDLQDEPLEIKVMDYDTISSDDAIGTVFIDLNSLLAWEADEIDDSTTVDEGQIDGWFPIYDNLRGIRGEIHIIVKIEFFGDVNPFKDSSASVQIFTSPSLPEGYRLDDVMGLVDALLNDDDPEYHWTDTFRAPRVSNESRQKLLYRLSGRLRRQIGKEVLERGGNAILGFKQSFDFENEEQVITGRAIGTCVRLSVVESDDEDTDDSVSSESCNAQSTSKRLSSSPGNLEIFSVDELHHEENEFDNFVPNNPYVQTDTNSPKLREKSRDYGASSRGNPSLSIDDTYPNTGLDSSEQPADLVSHSEIGSSSYKNYSLMNHAKLSQYRQPADVMLLTLDSLPRGTIINIGGVVSSRSVKLYQNDEEEVRDAWWDELRHEIQSHAKALSCTVVLNYTEKAAMQDELVILSAIGTAVNVDTSLFSQLTDHSLPNYDLPPEMANFSTAPGSLGSSGPARAVGSPEEVLATSPLRIRDTVNAIKKANRFIPVTNSSSANLACRACHIPYFRKQLPFQMGFSKCQICKKKNVPEILFTTIQPPTELSIIGDGSFIEAHICRRKKKKEGETNASIVGDILPFVEYDIHRQLLYKLRIQGLNSIFGLKISLAISDSLIVAVASGTAVFLSALPLPPPLRIARNLDVVDAEDMQFLEMQKKIMALSDKNREIVEKARLGFFKSHDSLPNVAEFPETSTSTSSNTRATSINRSKSIIVPNKDPMRESISKNSPGRVRNRKKYPNMYDSDSDVSDSDTDSDIEGEGTTNIVVQIDDDTDEDLMAVLLDPAYNDFVLCNTEKLPYYSSNMENLFRLSQVTKYSPELEQSGFYELCSSQMITAVKEGSLKSVEHHPNRQLAALFKSLFDSISSSLSYFHKCILLGIETDLFLPKDDEIHIRLTAMAIGQHSTEEEMEKFRQQANNLSVETSSPFESARSSTGAFETSDGANKVGIQKLTGMDSAANFAEITPLSYVPGGTIVQYRGRISLHFVKEDLVLHKRTANNYYGDISGRESITSDMSRFIHKFVTEILAICRSHALSYGGNAIISFRIEHSHFDETLKNQAYGFLSVSGDVVDVRYSSKHKPLQSSTPLLGINMVDMMWKKYKKNWL